MQSQKFDDTLIRILEEEVQKEKFAKKAKIKGKLIQKWLSKKGNIMLAVSTKGNKYEVVVPQYKIKEYKLADSISEGSIIKIIGDERLSGIIYCDLIEMISGKENCKEFQSKLK